MFDLEKVGLFAALVFIIFHNLVLFVEGMARENPAGPACWQGQLVYAKPMTKDLFRIEGPEYAPSGNIVRYVKYGTVRRRDINFEIRRCWKRAK